MQNNQCYREVYHESGDIDERRQKSQGDCATLGNLRYFVKQSKSLDLSLSDQI